MVDPPGGRLWTALDLPATSLVPGLLLILAVATVLWVLGGGGVHVSEGPAVRISGVSIEYAGVESTEARVAVVNPRSDPVVGTVTVNLRTGVGETVFVGRSRVRLVPGTTIVTVRFDPPVPAGRYTAVRAGVSPAVRTTDSPRPA